MPVVSALDGLVLVKANGKPVIVDGSLGTLNQWDVVACHLRVCEHGSHCVFLSQSGDVEGQSVGQIFTVIEYLGEIA